MAPAIAQIDPDRCNHKQTVVFVLVFTFFATFMPRAPLEMNCHSSLPPVRRHSHPICERGTALMRQVERQAMSSVHRDSRREGETEFNAKFRSTQSLLCRWLACIHPRKLLGVWQVRFLVLPVLACSHCSRAAARLSCARRAMSLPWLLRVMPASHLEPSACILSLRSR